jgi:hypothetical protein
VRQVGRKLLELRNRRKVILAGEETRRSEQARGPVGDGMVEIELPHSIPLEEEQKEGPGKPSLSPALVKPELAIDDLVPAAEPLDGLRLSQQDVVAPAVGAPSRPERVSSEELIGVIDPLVVLLAKLVHRRRRVWIASRPERIDKAIALLNRLELPKDLLLPVGDDVDDVFFDPLPVGVGHLSGEREHERHRKHHRH